MPTMRTGGGHFRIIGARCVQDRHHSPHHHIPSINNITYHYHPIDIITVIIDSSHSICDPYPTLPLADRCQEPQNGCDENECSQLAQSLRLHHHGAVNICLCCMVHTYIHTYIHTFVTRTPTSASNRSKVEQKMRSGKERCSKINLV